jgi:hypothetical protein
MPQGASETQAATKPFVCDTEKCTSGATAKYGLPLSVLQISVF